MLTNRYKSFHHKNYIMFQNIKNHLYVYRYKIVQPNFSVLKRSWTTKETFKLYLLGIRDYYNFPNEILHIILDCYKVHISEKIIGFAENNNFKLYFIPHGYTDRLQPLDVKLFGILKAYARRLFLERYRNDPYKKRNKIDACQDLICSWEKLDRVNRYNQRIYLYFLFQKCSSYHSMHSLFFLVSI